MKRVPAYREVQNCESEGGALRISWGRQPVGTRISELRFVVTDLMVWRLALESANHVHRQSMGSEGGQPLVGIADRR